jgi:hypothetical protein
MSIGREKVSPLRRVSVLAEASKQGCVICAFFLNVTEQVFPGWMLSDSEVKSISVGKDEHQINLWHHGQFVANFQIQRRFTGNDKRIPTRSGREISVTC